MNAGKLTASAGGPLHSFRSMNVCVANGMHFNTWAPFPTNSKAADYAMYVMWFKNISVWKCIPIVGNVMLFRATIAHTHETYCWRALFLSTRTRLDTVSKSYVLSEIAWFLLCKAKKILNDSFQNNHCAWESLDFRFSPIRFASHWFIRCWSVGQFSLLFSTVNLLSQVHKSAIIFGISSRRVRLCFWNVTRLF